MKILDCMRILMGLFAACGIGLTCMIIFHYARLIRRGVNTQMPSHIFMVGASYTMAMIYVSCDQAGRLDTRLTWRMPLAIVCAIVGIPALASVLRNVHDRDIEG